MIPKLSRERLNPRIRICFLTFILLTHLCISSAFATDAAAPERAKLPINVLLGVAPFATHPATFPTSFNGIGTEAVLSAAPFSTLTESVEAGYLVQGQASMLWLGYNHYFSGAFQFAAPEGSTFEGGRYRGFFLGAAPVLYSLVNTNTATKKLTTYKGLGASFQLGVEQPIFSHFFVSARAGYLNSISTAGYYGFYTLLMVGLPFGF